MIRKLLLLVAASSLVVALPSSAEASSVDGAVQALIAGTVVVDGPGTACPPATYTNTAVFDDVEIAGAFFTGHPPGSGYVGVADVPVPIDACVVSFLSVNGLPLLSEGHITSGLFDDGGFPGVNGNCIEGDIDRGGFVTSGVAAAMHFSVDYDVFAAETSVTCPGALLSSSDNVPCLGAIVLASNPLTGVATMTGSITCGAVRATISS